MSTHLYLCSQTLSLQIYCSYYILVFLPVVLSQLTITTLPEALFLAGGGVRNVVEGSVIQLFCSIQSTTATFSWTKNGSAVVVDVPHLRERTTIDSTTTTSMLTVDNFQSTDNGEYQCMAHIDLENSEAGGTANLRGLIVQYSNCTCMASFIYNSTG